MRIPGDGIGRFGKCFVHESGALMVDINVL